MRVAYFLVFVFFVAVAISLYHRKPPEIEPVYHPDQRLLDEISFQQELIDSLLPLTAAAGGSGVVIVRYKFQN